MEPKLLVRNIYGCYCPTTEQRVEFEIQWPPAKEICPICGCQHGKGFMECNFTLEKVKVFKSI